MWGASDLVATLTYRDAVSSRAPVWGASSQVLRPGLIAIQFQVVPPCGGHLHPSFTNMISQMFQVVPPCGGHPILLSLCMLLTMFQVVPPCGGHPIIFRYGFFLRGFKSCPRVGGIVGTKGFWVPDNLVSSRAPVWGASYMLTTQSVG